MWNVLFWIGVGFIGGVVLVLLVTKLMPSQDTDHDALDAAARHP